MRGEHKTSTKISGRGKGVALFGYRGMETAVYIYMGETYRFRVEGGEVDGEP